MRSLGDVDCVILVKAQCLNHQVVHPSHSARIKYRGDKYEYCQGERSVQEVHKETGVNIIGVRRMIRNMMARKMGLFVVLHWVDFVPGLLMRVLTPEPYKGLRAFTLFQAQQR